MYKRLRNNISSLCIGLVAVICIWNCFNERCWYSRGVLMNDIASYYAYLPVFINHKTDSLTEDEIRFAPYILMYNKLTPLPNGNRIIKTTYGAAAAYLPNYMAGYIWRLIRYGNPGWGYEYEYRFSMQFWGTFVLIFGLIVLRRLLNRYFTDVVTAAVLLLIALGTNLFYYTVYDGCMTHVINFALISLFILLTLKWYEKPLFKYSVLLGLLSGYIVLIRPVNILVGVFFLFYAVNSVATFNTRLKLLLRNWWLISIMGICALIVWVPQIIYWYHYTGHLFFNPYLNENFFFFKSKLVYGLIGWRKGWLIYTPLGFFMLAGFFLLPKYVKGYLFATAAFYLTFVYIIFCWWCWWYGGSFGCRPMIDIYGLLAIPLAAFIAWLRSKNQFLQMAFAFLFTAIIGLNLVQTYQMKKVIISPDAMSRQAYMYDFLRLNHGAPDYMLSPPPWGDAAEGKYTP